MRKQFQGDCLPVVVQLTMFVETIRFYRETEEKEEVRQGFQIYQPEGHWQSWG